MLDVTVTVDGAATGGAYALLDVRATAGTVVAPHSALSQDVTLIVLAGAIEVVGPQQRCTLEAGDHFALARSTPRWLSVLADAHVLVLSTPSGLERLAELLRPPIPSPDDLAALLSTAGVTLLPRSWRAA